MEKKYSSRRSMIWPAIARSSRGTSSSRSPTRYTRFSSLAVNIYEDFGCQRWLYQYISASCRYLSVFDSVFGTSQCIQVWSGLKPALRAFQVCARDRAARSAATSRRAFGLAVPRPHVRRYIKKRPPPFVLVLLYTFTNICVGNLRCQLPSSCPLRLSYLCISCS